MLTLEDYVNQFNRRYERNRICVTLPHYQPTFARPTSIEVRYCASWYQHRLTTQEWVELNDLLEAKSYGTLYVATDNRLFGRGIIEIKIATMNRNYSEEKVVNALRWVCEEFLMRE